ncbi:MAG: S-layer homology domain-containing protein [Eubacteriales bacterium]|nr:S-layer homology domain-containing protein [Eubacteriales bacterium]
MKKIIFCLSAMLCFGSIALAYGGNNWGFDNFSSSTLDSRFTVSNQTAGNIAELNSESGEFRLHKTQTAGSIALTYTLPEAISTGAVAYELSFYMSGSDGIDIQVKTQNNANQDISFHRLRQNSYFSVRDVVGASPAYIDFVSMPKLEKDRKTRIKVVIDYDAPDGQNITTFMDGTELPNKVGFNSGRVNAQSGVKKIYIYIPTANTGAGVVIDELRIYPVGSDAEKVLSAWDLVDIPNPQDVTQDLILPTSEGEVSISWESSDTSVITDEGKITASYLSDRSADLTATFTLGDVTITKSFNIVVKKLESDLTDQELVDLASQSFSLGDVSAVMENIHLPLVDPIYGTNISWVSNHEALSDTGIVTRGEVDITVKLTATFSKNAASATKDFYVTVLRIIPEVSEIFYIVDEAEISKSSFWTLTGASISDGKLIVEKNAENEKTSVDSRRILNEPAKGLVTIEYTYTLDGESTSSNNFLQVFVYGTYKSGEPFEIMKRFEQGSNIQVRLPSGYKNLTRASQKGTQYRMKIVVNTIKSEYDIYIDGEIYHSSGALAQEIDSISSLRWYIPTIVSANTKLVVEDLSVGVQQEYRSMIAADLSLISLDLPQIIRRNILLPTKGVNGSNIRWQSSNPSLLTINNDTAILKGPDAYIDRAGVTLTAFVSAGEWEDKKDFFIELYGIMPEDIGAKQGVAHKLTLPTTWIYDDSIIEWSSNDCEIISNEDETYVSGYYLDSPSKQVTLIASVKSKAGETLGTKHLEITLENPSYYNLARPNLQYPDLVITSSWSSKGDTPAGVLWTCVDTDTNPYYIMGFGTEITFNTINISAAGDNVHSFKLLTSQNASNWTAIASLNEGTVHLAPLAAKYIKIEVTPISLGPVGIENIELFYKYSDEIRVSDNFDGISLPSAVTSNITLPTIGKTGLEISWKSSNSGSITDTGIVLRKEKSIDVVMTATVSHNNARLSKPFTVTVIGTGSTSGPGGTVGQPSGRDIKGGGGGSYPISPPANATILEPNEPISAFDDVAQDFWAWEYIVSLKSRGILNGTSPNKFEPNRDITRAEFLKLIISISNIDLDNDAKVPFEDIDASAWYAPYVKTAYKLGIINGVEKNRFGVDESVRRQDIAVIITRLFDYKDMLLPHKVSAAEFLDIQDLSSEAKESISSLQSAGVLSGKNEGEFSPNQSATRAEVAKIIYYINQILN